MKIGFFRAAVVLGLLTAIGPFAIDMYLPALPSIGQSLGAAIGPVQLSLTAFFLSMGAGQLVWGPVSDMAGRKAPLYLRCCCSRRPASAARWPATSAA